MDFINKLIKKGIFGLLLTFSFFLFSNEIMVKAEESCITLNDENDYLVVNTGLGWKDSGVKVTCSGVINPANVFVQINDSKPIETTDYGLSATNGFVFNPGFYKIKYYVIDGEGQEVASTTRQMRVLPNNLNSINNVWVGEANKVNTAGDDVFNKILSTSDGYLAVGNFGKAGYIVSFNARGEFLWKEEFVAMAGNSVIGLSGVTTIDGLNIDSVMVNDVLAGDNGKLFYISGGYVDKTYNARGFITTIQLNEGNTSSGRNREKRLPYQPRRNTRVCRRSRRAGRQSCEQDLYAGRRVLQHQCPEAARSHSV